MKYFFLFSFFLFSSFLFGQEKSNKLIREGIEATAQRDHSKALMLLVQAKDLALENQWHEQLFLAFNNIGSNYYSMLEYGEALENYLEAYKVAIQNLGPKQEMVALNNIAILYSKEKKYDKAEEYFERAYEIAKKNKAAKKIAMYGTNLAIIANEKGELSKAEKLLKEGIELSEKFPGVLLEAKVILAKNYLLKKDYKGARSIAMKLLPKLNNIRFSQIRNSMLLIISESYESENNLDPAIEYAVKPVQDSLITLELKITGYKQLSDLYEKKQLYTKSLSIKDSILKVTNKLNDIKNGRLFESSREKFEIENYRKRLNDQLKKTELERKNFYTTLTLALLFVIITIWAFRNLIIKNRQRKIIDIRNQEFLKLELEKEKSENLLLEKELKNEIETKNRKLSAKALFLSDRNKLIQSIIEDLESNNLEKLPSLQKSIHNLKNHLRTDDELDDFVKHFEEVNQGFLSNLKKRYPSINANDIRFISYVYMHLTSKEIASILNITPEACRKRKERISKKLGLTDSKELYNYLSSI